MKWKSKNSLKRCGASHSMKISHLNKIHFSLDPLKERSAEYHHVSDLVAEQRAFWQKNRHRDRAWPLPQFSLQTGVNKTRGRGLSLSFIFRECCFRFRVMVRLGFCFTDTLRKPSHGFLSVRSLESWKRCTCILCMWLPFLVGQATGVSLTS